MSDHTGIEWTEKTWNPWHGCTKVSDGCDHCYMFREKKQYGQDPELVVRSKTKFKDPLRWKEPALVFTCSWSDWFHIAADAWRDEAWAIVKATPHLTYQILTKRPGRIHRHLPADWGEGYPNVWLGVSVECQAVLTRAFQLANVPAAVRFISAEPLLGPVYLPQGFGESIHWVIGGGESGPDARRCDPSWLRILRDDCAREHVPFFLKQLGGWPDKRGGEKAVLDGLRSVEMPAGVSV